MKNSSLARCLTLGVAALFLSTPGVQSADNKLAAPNGRVITVRELSIPERAREEMQDGIRRLARGDLSGSMAGFRHAIKKFPGYYEAYFFMGLADMDIEHYADAERNFRKSMELSRGDYAPAYFGLAAALCGQRDFAEAMMTAWFGLKEEGNSWFGYYTMARAQFALGRLEDADKSAREALLRNPDLPEIYQLRVYIHARQNNASAVVQDLDEFIALDSENAKRVGALEIRDKIRRILDIQSNALATATVP